MRIGRSCTVAALLVLLLAGCWNRRELTDWGFVQAAAIDETGKGDILLTAQIYRPSGSSSQSGVPTAKGSSFVDTASINGTVNGASSDATNELGRKLQWSHMRVLLIGEDIARKRNIGEFLDFFARSHEPRGSIVVLITQGPAKAFLEIQPLIEGTIGQQLKSIVELAQHQSGKAIVMTLKELTILSKRPRSEFVIPYVKLRKESHAVASVGGLALFGFPAGKMTGVVPSGLTPYVLMLKNRYRGGFLNIPCAGKDSAKDSFDISRSHTKIRVQVKGGELGIRINVELEGIIGELGCSNAETSAEIARFTGRVEQETKDRLSEAVTYMQRNRKDLLGVGLKVYRWHNRTWKSWQSDWDKRFAEASVDIAVKAMMLNSGMNPAKPFSSREPEP